MTVNTSYLGPFEKENILYGLPQITLNILSNHNQPCAANVYQKYKAPFFKYHCQTTSKKIAYSGMKTCKFYGFETTAQAQAYLTSN